MTFDSPANGRRPVPSEPRLHDELVLIDQPALGQRQRKGHACGVEALAGLLLQTLDGLDRADRRERSPHSSPASVMVFDTTYFFAGPMALANGIIQSGIPSRRTPVSLGLRQPALHHSVDDPAEDQRIGPRDGLGGVAMQLCVRNPHLMIDAAIQRDVDREPKRAHAQSPSSALSRRYAIRSTCAQAVWNSVIAELPSRASKAARIEALVLSRTAMMKGKPNFCDIGSC